MRLWTIHPRYLDRQGLTGLWREALGAQQNLIADQEGRKIGYDKHPQLIRFRDHQRPLDALATYMLTVWKEASSRGYEFDWDKVKGNPFSPWFGSDMGMSHYIPVSTDQVTYERAWLAKKLINRVDIARYNKLMEDEFIWHPLFTVYHGPIEAWERVPEEVVS